MSVVIGWDIGGAHLKAARVKDGRVEAVVQAATPLWLGLDSLEAAFDALRAQLGHADHHVITMTGELCDAFPSRREGVAGLAAIAANHLAPAAPSLYAGRAGFVELGEAAPHAADIASANWHASAALVALKLRDALFIDIGSTTTDHHSSRRRPGRGGRLQRRGTARFGRTRLYRNDAQLRHVVGLPGAVSRRLDAADERIFRQQRRRSSHSRRLARGRGQNGDRRRPREDRRGFAGASCADDRTRGGRRRRFGMGWACRLVRGSANTPNRRRGLAAPVPQRCGGCGARDRSRRRGRRRGGSRAPPATALRRIFFADRGPRGSLALRARGRGCIAWRGRGKRSGRVR